MSNSMINILTSGAIWGSDETGEDWTKDIAIQWYDLGKICKHLGLPLSIRIYRNHKWDKVKSKMGSKLTKWNFLHAILGSRGVLASYLYMGFFSYYGITTTPLITNPRTNDIDKMFRIFLKRRISNPS